MAQWDAFISYARSASTLEAQKLQTALQTFAKPWYRLRAVRIFRDDSSMSANPGLWTTIEEGLREARWLVLLLSPTAARSEYVANEIGWWLRHKEAASILLVHDEGTLAWDRVRNDFAAASDCIPAPLRGAFREEPRWTDLSWFDAPGSSGASDPRFTEKVADLASAIRGVPRDELLGEDVAQHKRSWRLARAAIGVLSLLLIAAVVASVIALAQRNEVLRQANTLLARQLAATSDSLLARDLRRAQLLAVRAYRTDPTPETRAALLRSSLASPALRRFVTFDAAIRSVDASASGRYLIVGLVDGRVFSLDVATGTPLQRLTLQSEVVDVAISDDGTVVAAVDGGSSVVATGTDVGQLDLPPGQAPSLVAVNPSGAGVVVASKGTTSMITLAEVNDLAGQGTRTLPDRSSAFGALDLQFVGDDRIVLSGSGSDLRSFPGFERIGHGTAFYGARQRAARNSADGAWATATNDAAEVPVWRLDGDQDDPARFAVVPTIYAIASALNHDGTLLAVADASGVRVAEVRSTKAAAGFGHSTEQAISYPGTGPAIDRGVLFLGTSARFAVASGHQLSLWDPDSAGRPGATGSVDVATACTACGSPSVAVSPDGTTMAVRDGDESSVLVSAVPGQSGRFTATVGQAAPAGLLAPPVWLDDATVLVVASGSDSEGGTLTGPLPGLPAGVTGWAIGQPGTRVLAVRVSPDGATALVVDANGRLARYRTGSGELLSERRIPGAQGWLFDAAISPDLADVILLPNEGEEALMVDVATGAERYRVRSGTRQVARALFAAGSLWIRGSDGAVQRHDPASGALQRVLPGSFPGWLPLAGASGVVVIPTEIDTSLYDATADAILDSAPLPTGWTAVRRGAGLSADGSALVTVFEKPGDGSHAAGLAVALDLDAEHLVATVCRTSGGSLTLADWTELIGGAAPEELTCR